MFFSCFFVVVVVVVVAFLSCLYGGFQCNWIEDTSSLKKGMWKDWRVSIYFHGLRDISCKKNKIIEDTSLVEKGM